eukprot:scaffold1140_cov251-Pinguiococcus_pyrenoidosus.AAC.15
MLRRCAAAVSGRLRDMWERLGGESVALRVGVRRANAHEDNVSRLRIQHGPRGSNDRNCETNANRNNGNRLFDSQNNAAGGYACPRAKGGPERGVSVSRGASRLAAFASWCLAAVRVGGLGGAPVHSALKKGACVAPAADVPCVFDPGRKRRRGVHSRLQLAHVLLRELQGGRRMDQPARLRQKLAGAVPGP